MTKVDISILTEEQQERVLDWIDRAKRAYLTDHTRAMTMREAAEAYGYTYGTIRVYVHDGLIKSIGKGHGRRITHEAMLDYIVNKSVAGRPCNSELK